MKKTSVDLYMRSNPVLLTVAVFVAGMAGCSSREPNSGIESSRSALNSNPQAADFAIYAQNSATLRDRVSVSGGDVGVRLAGTGPFIGGAYELVLSSEVKVDPTRSVLGNQIQLQNRASVGDVQVSQLINQNGSYAQKYPFPATMPDLPPLEPVTAGTTPFTVGIEGTRVASPGSYGAVTVGRKGTLRLESGVYEIASLQMDNDARLEVLGPVQLRVAGRFSALDRTFIGAATDVIVTAGDLRIEVSGKNGNSGSLADMPKAAVFGNDTVVTAVLLVSNGSLHSGQRSRMVGAYVARDIYLDMDSKITFQSGMGPLGCQESCDDANPCTEDSCSAGVCVHTNSPVGTICGDGNACNGDELCDGAGQCEAGIPIVCEETDQCYMPSICDPATGTCSNSVMADGSGCNDGNGCTQTDTCQAGVCTGTNPVICTASDQCHTLGTCDPATGTCSNPPVVNGTACNDANACTQVDACMEGVCSGSNPVTCTATGQCHDVGICNPATAICSNPNKPDGTACDDGNGSTIRDVCIAGSCVGFR